MNFSSGAGGRRSRRGHRRAPMAEINVTPLVDVMLVLLIIFMVTAPLLVTGVPVELPESRANALDQKDEPVEIAIDRDGATFIDETEVPPSELAARRPRHQLRPDDASHGRAEPCRAKQRQPGHHWFIRA